MRFTIQWTLPDVGNDPEYSKLVTAAVVGYIDQGCPMDEFEGFKILERVHYPGIGGMQIVEAESMAHIYTFTAPWGKNFGMIIEVLPALTDEQIVNVEKTLAES